MDNLNEVFHNSRIYSEAYDSIFKRIIDTGEITNDSINVYLSNFIHKYVLDNAEILDDVPIIINCREYKKYKYKDIEFYSDGWIIKRTIDYSPIVVLETFSKYFKIQVLPI